MDASVFPLLFLIVVGAAFWLLVIRPARARQQQQVAVVAALQPGTTVLLASGMIGEVVTVHDDDLEIRIAPGVVVTFVKQAVLRTVEPDEMTGRTPDTSTESPDTTSEASGTDR